MRLDFVEGGKYWSAGDVVDYEIKNADCSQNHEQVDEIYYGLHSHIVI